MGKRQNNKLNSQVGKAHWQHISSVNAKDEERYIFTFHIIHEQDALKCQARYMYELFIIGRFLGGINNLNVQNLFAPSPS